MEWLDPKGFLGLGIQGALLFALISVIWGAKQMIERMQDRHAQTVEKFATAGEKDAEATKAMEKFIAVMCERFESKIELKAKEVIAAISEIARKRG